jgi:hypothetical protein
MSLYQACQRLFNDYPLGIRVSDCGPVHSIVLIVGEGDGIEFYVLSDDRGDGAPLYSIRPWPTGKAVRIVATGDDHVPEALANAVTRGVPLPRHGSIFGWLEGDVVTALIVLYTEYEANRTLPRWTVMPLVGTPESRWPPFIGKRIFGWWFWDYYQNNSVVPLDGLIAKNPGAVFWVNTQAAIGSDCCAVARDITATYTLPRGSYAYSGALQADEAIPSLAELLADEDGVDLSPRFWRSA